MTHEELLAKIATPNEFIGVKYAPDWQSAALRAVVELHKPSEQFETDAWCLECTTKGKVPAYYTVYPCPTIQAIIENLK